MTRYPNSDCEKHRDVTTDAPICPACMAETIDAQAAELAKKDAEIERLQVAIKNALATLSELGDECAAVEILDGALKGGE